MIVVAGESLVDLLVRPDGSVTATPGGGPYNVARALGRLGVPTAFVGRISTDRFGRILRERLAADGVDLAYVVATDDPTLLAVAEIDEHGAATYRFHSAGTAAPGLVAADLPDGLPSQTWALHVGTLGIVLEPMATTIEGLVAAVAPDALVFLDLNVRPAAIDDAPAFRARLDRLLRRADIVKASIDDLAWLAPGRDPLEVGGSLAAGGGSAAVLVTAGPNPVRIVRRTGVDSVPVPAVRVVDTVGAGDAFGAGFLAGWHRAGRRRSDLADHGAVLEATRLAVQVGAATVTRAGAEPPWADELGRDPRGPPPARHWRGAAFATPDGPCHHDRDGDHDPRPRRDRFRSEAIRAVSRSGRHPNRARAGELGALRRRGHPVGVRARAGVARHRHDQGSLWPVHQRPRGAVQ